MTLSGSFILKSVFGQQLRLSHTYLCVSYIFLYQLIVPKMGINYPDLEPSDEFCNWVWLPVSCCKSLLLRTLLITLCLSGHF